MGRYNSTRVAIRGKDRRPFAIGMKITNDRGKGGRYSARKERQNKTKVTHGKDIQKGALFLSLG